MFMSIQNGAPPDWSRPVKQWLNQKLPSRWIVKGSDDDTKMKWPSRSIDLVISFYDDLSRVKIIVRNPGILLRTESVK